MSAGTLSQRIWDGEYGWGRGGVLYEARKLYENSNEAGLGPFAAYASALYSVMNGAFVRGPFYWPLGLFARWRLVRLINDISAWLPFLGKGASPDEYEVLAAIFIRLASRYLATGRDIFRCETGLNLARLGIASGVDREVSPHTLAFLNLHVADSILRMIEYVKSNTSKKKLRRQLSVLEEERARQATYIQNAVRYAPQVLDRNQRSRVYRNIAELYHQFGDRGKANFFMDTADAVSDIAASVREKNAAARRRMRL
jgi:hypothetical protein